MRTYNIQTRKMFSVGTKKSRKKPTEKKPTKSISREDLKKRQREFRIDKLKKDKGFASSEFATAKDKQKFLDNNRRYFPKTKMGKPSKALKMIKTELPNATTFKKGGRV